MKRTLQLLLAMSFVAMFLVSPVAAATSQGLEWGVAIDDSFAYQMTFTEEGVQTFAEGVNVTLTTAPPTIDDPLINWTDMGYPDLNMTFYNGTSLGLYGILLIGFLAIGGYFAVPIGNFSLLTDLVSAESFWNENVSLIDNALYWGITWTGMDEDIEQTISGEYLKADGFVARYILQATNTTSSVVSSVTLIRNNLPVLTTTTTTSTNSTGFDIVGFVQDNILYIGVGIAVLLVLVIIIKRR
jgi:hypothetical protein